MARVWDPFPWRRTLVALLSAMLFGALAGASTLRVYGPISALPGYLAAAIALALGSMFGGLIGWLWFRRARYGVPRKLQKDQARWLVPEETVLILLAPVETLRFPVAVLRESGDHPPAVFVIHPERQGLVRAPEGRPAPVSLAQMQEHAQAIAAIHALDPRPLRGNGLLGRLEGSHRWIHQISADLSEASRLDQSGTPTAEWILDNEYLVDSNARDIRLNLPQRFYQELPALTNTAHKGLPRIYGLAEELAGHADLRLDRENILAFFEAYQSARALTIGELWAVPQMLRIALLEGIRDLAAGALTELWEGERADLWANRLIRANRRDPNHLYAILAELAATQPEPSPYFAAQLVDHLYDEEAALVLVQSWLERTSHQPLGELSLAEQNRQTKNQISVGNAFTSLRQLALLDWRQIFERLSRVEESLRQDPAGVYAAMDFDTRDRYRGAIEALARGSRQPQEHIAQRAVELASRAAPMADAVDAARVEDVVDAVDEAHVADAGTGDERRNHVGTYLIGEGRRELARLIGCREAPRFRILQLVYRHHTAMYFVGFGLLCALFAGPIVTLGLAGPSRPLHLLAAPLAVALLALIPVSQLAQEVLNYLLMRLLPPRALPKMDFELDGIPDHFRTFVVVPMLLTDAPAIRSEIEKLEIRYLANKEDNLLFGLFSDFTDSNEGRREDDESMLQTAMEGITALNDAHGGERFLLLHRDRTWSESERKFIGFERKRGKLEALNRLINGARPADAPPMVVVGDLDQLSNVRFVITLDSDTQLPAGTARRLIETLAHPLNQPRFDALGRIRAGTHTIIQPRVSPSLPSASASHFSRLFADAVGIDPYTKAVSDVHQDLAGEGTYHGKGIYDVRAFDRVLSGRFPEGLLLSHDLIEGAHVRVGLASDIELFDEFPRGYLAYTTRQHRWIRGDWQIADWILPRVPLPGGGRGPNPLSWFDRWKVFDNLRRSLVPASSLALLVVTWLTSTPLGWIASALVAAQLLFQPLAQPLTMATTSEGLKGFSFSKMRHDLWRAMADAALLPHQAGLALDAILRVWFRRLVSHRDLLQWTSSEVDPWHTPGQKPMFVISLALASLFGVAAAWVVQRFMPSSLVLAGPWLVLWVLAPLVGWLLNLPPTEIGQGLRMEQADELYLRHVARRTWRYFSDFVGEETAWLPPDNYQVAYQNQLAMRTSPTNIGLGMLGTLAAHEFGYVTADQVVEKLSRTMETIAKLERHEGHLLNWYDLATLTPLEPRYVSTVDSGNFLAALWTLDYGLGELRQHPLLDRTALLGLRDTGSMVKQVVGQARIAGLETEALDELARAWEAPPARVVDLVRLLKRSAAGAHSLARAVGGSAGAGTEAVYWAGELEREASAWSGVADRYLAWVEVLAEKTEAELAALGSEAVAAIGLSLAEAPSLEELANGQIGSMRLLQAIRGAAFPLDPSLAEWFDRLQDAFLKAQWLAGEQLSVSERLSEDLRALSEAINMRFLYDGERRLFTIGYNVTECRLDGGFYDLLASEARLGSFVAIARGDVPYEHWFAMGRPFRAIGRRRVLLSWTGTMFEYLMPLIFQRALRNTLLDDAAKAAVTIQMAYAKKRRVPWGISESAFGDLDRHRTYQYKAFGVPDLALKRGLEEKVVVAPYATFLALAVAPGDVVQNLRRLAGLGLFGDYGYFDSIDYSRQPSRGGKSGVIVQAYMAHHQGMSFLALSNFLHGDSLQRQFHADARVRAVEPLLHERVPVLPPLHHIATRERVPAAESVGEVAPSVSKFTTPHTGTPKTQLLSNGRYGLMVTNAGGGYSQWSSFEITRWRSDRTEDAWGTFLYLYEAETDRLWSNTYHPTGGSIQDYAANFALDRAAFRRDDHGIQTETDVIVSPEDDVEIRRVTLINRSGRPRRLDLTSYVELSMAPHNADRQHPAFSKLFIQTEALAEAEALLAHRRPRGEDSPPLYVAHRLTVGSAASGPFSFETDRAQFIGRGRTMANPQGARQKPTGSQGFVLDPILSLRHRLTLGPGERVQVSLVLAAGDSREGVLGLMGKYGDPHAIDRAMDVAWASSQVELRVLRIQPDEARRYQQLASHLLFPNPLLRPPAERLKENRKGQAGLWPYGISGDLPIALVTIGLAQDIGLLRQMLQAHTYWRMHGLMADLVILNEESDSYGEPLRERIESLVQAHSTYTGTDQPGGIFLRSTAQIPAADLRLLMAAARVALVAARGTLAQHLVVPAEASELAAPPAKKRLPREPSASLSFMDLAYFNGLGGFTPDGREYAIYLGPHVHTPAPWVNVLANPHFGALVSEAGSGFTWYGNSQRNRLTEWSNDPITDPPSEVVYIRDEESSAYWTPTALPIREETAYRARHGAGYSHFEHNSNGIEAELTVLVPMDAGGGQPIKLQRLRLRNDSTRRRKLSVTYYAAWTLGEDRESSQMHVVTHWDDDVKAIVSRNRYHPDYGDRVAFAAIHPPPESFTGDRTSFIGRNRSLANPAAMDRSRLSRQTGAGLDPCAAQRLTVLLAPGERAELTLMLGQAASLEEAHELVRAYRKDAAFGSALDQTTAWWDDLLGTIEVQTPELAADLMINRWLLYQSLACRIWGRSGFYQSGGAFGFRDQLQDVMALAYAHPQLAREHILYAASRQFKEGDVQHWWHRPGGAGIRSRISDDSLWLPYVVSQYVRVTGDVGILHQETAFLDAPPLEAGQHERFLTPVVALEGGTLFEHCRRSVARGMALGAHGLPLMGTGDWNDGLNLVGAGGRGESVWLAWFLVDVLGRMTELAGHMGQPELAATFDEDRRALVGHIELAAWDGDWYRRAFFDDGSPLGSARNVEARIDSLPQSWAWLTGAAEPDRAAKALESAWQQLVREDDGLVLLFTPPFESSMPSPGYIKGYPPGVRENGGQYTHAALWLAMAMARSGDGTRAAQILRIVNPIERAREPEMAARYKVEPYVVAADVYRLAGQVGRGGWTWYTGSAAWLYRAWVEEVLGVGVQGDRLRVNPVIPAWWDGFRVRLRHGEAVYEIQVENPEKIESGVAWVEVDGQRLGDGEIPLERGLVKHRVVVRMGRLV